MCNFCITTSMQYKVSLNKYHKVKLAHDNCWNPWDFFYPPIYTWTFLWNSQRYKPLIVILSLKKAKIAGAKRTAFDSHHMLYRAEMYITLVVGKSGLLVFFFFFLVPVISFNFLIIILKLILKTVLVLETDDS